MGTLLLGLHNFTVIAPLSSGIYYGSSCSGKHWRMTSLISPSKCLRSSLSLKFNYLYQYRWLWINFWGWVLSISENSILSEFQENSHNFVVNFCPYLFILYLCHGHHFSLNWVSFFYLLMTILKCIMTLIVGRETVHFL